MSDLPNFPAAPASILVVDDRPENLRAVEAVLEPLACRIVTANSGREALKLLLDEQFAVILLDVQMPDMDGFETASYIRDHHRTRTIPIIFLSAISTSSEHVFRGYEAGAVDYIVKPMDPVVIRSKVRVFVELYQRGEEIRRQADALRERDRERARRDAERRRHRRASLLAAVSLALERRSDIPGRIDQLVRSCVPALGELALAQVFAGEGRPRTAVALACASPADDEALRELLSAHPEPPAGGIVDEQGHIESQADRAAWLDILPGLMGESVWARLAPESLIVVPLMLQGRQLGRLTLARSASDDPFGEEELELALELAKRAALALETSRLYELERDRSRTLQLSLLGESTLAHPVVTAASRYLPGSADLDVGGDWSDLIQRDDGRIFAVVGDVVGRGIRAATAMGRLRSAIGALALVTDDTATLLKRLDQYAARIPEASLATVVCAQIDPEDGTVTYSSAGHLPGLVVLPDGEATFLEEGRSYPLGVDISAPRDHGRTTLAPGATLILFTDGLVESRTMPIESRLEHLRQAASARATHEPERLCDELVEELVDGPGDDVALVCVRFSPVAGEFLAWEFPALPNEVGPARHRLVQWLSDQGVSKEACGDLALAFGEASANAVRHGIPAGDGYVAVQLRLHGGNLTVRVRDTGRWIEPQPSSEGGRGLEIMRALADDVHVHGTAHGTTVVMHKNLETHLARAASSRDTATVS
jgi:CheY-like chemotaxis protein/serine phosphatase RsbU (regulator of sigma subunit)/anti-sigma regulatory factor (Ser/Thr protein kinase)